jgi:hypothetical protein
MTRGEHGHPEREGYGTTHVSDVIDSGSDPTEPASSGR